MELIEPTLSIYLLYFNIQNGAYEFADANTLEKAGTFVSMKRLVNKGVWLISYRPRSI